MMNTQTARNEMRMKRYWEAMFLACESGGQREAVHKRWSRCKYNAQHASEIERAGVVRKSLAHWRKREPDFTPNKRVYRHWTLPSHYRMLADHYGHRLP